MTQIDWSRRTPRERGVLCFIRRGGELLLILKKRGLGVGKVNAPGGKIEPGESPREAAIRETREEVGVTPLNPEERGEIFFQFTDGYSLHCLIFLAEGCEGEAIETDEAVPLWTASDAVPFDRMWADDIEWLPHLLAGRAFRGFFIFDGERMVLKQLEVTDPSQMNPKELTAPRRVLVAGCGLVGRVAARQLHALGAEVIGLTLSPQSARMLKDEPFEVRPGDILDREMLAALGPFDGVIDAVSSGRGGPDAYRRAYLEGAKSLLKTLRPERFVFAGSTSVYAQADGSCVDEESPAEPERETGKILREAEEAVLAAGGCVARLAGIYAVGRWAHLEKFLDGRAVIEGDGERVINQIHRDDAASALVFLLAGGAPAGIYNATDGVPLTQRELYAAFAQHFGRPLPPSGPPDLNRKRGWTSKRVSNAKLRALGWAPRRLTLRDALGAGEG